ARVHRAPARRGAARGGERRRRGLGAPPARGLRRVPLRHGRAQGERADLEEGVLPGRRRPALDREPRGGRRGGHSMSDDADEIETAAKGGKKAKATKKVAKAKAPAKKTKATKASAGDADAAAEAGDAAPKKAKKAKAEKKAPAKKAAAKAEGAGARKTTKKKAGKAAPADAPAVFPAPRRPAPGAS